MQKKFLVSLTATATAFSMLVAPCLTVFAENDAPLTTTQNITSESESPVTIDQDIIITDGSSAISASGSGTDVIMNGSIDQRGTYEHTSSSSGNTYTSTNSAVSVSSGASVTVNNDIVAGGCGASVRDESSLTVNGNLNVTGVETTTTVYDNDGNKINEYITVNSNGISTEGNGNIVVNGNIDSIKEGILINPDDDDHAGSITITGTITVSDNKQQGIEIFSPSVANGGNAYESKEDMLNDIPEITVYEIDTPSGYPVTVNSQSTSQDIVSQVRETVLSAINYIIKKDPNSVKDYGLEISGDDIRKRGAGNYDTINVNDSFVVALNQVLPEGYEVNGGNNVTVKQNENGTYTLTLTNNKGGIYVAVRLIPVTNEDGSTSYIVENESSNNDSTPSNIDPISTGAIIVSNTSSSAETAATAAAISGDKPARMVSYDIAKVTPAQYKESIISNVAAAPEGGALNIETDRVACFDRKMIEAIAARSDIDVNVVFTYGGKRLKVTIPAGYDVNSLLDEGGYCGFLRLMSILGSTEL